MGLILTYVWRIQDLFPILATVKLPILVSLAALALFIFEGHAARARDRFRHRVVGLATFLLVWMVFSVPGSVYQGLSFSFILDDHLKTYLMMLMIVASARDFAAIERLALVQVIGAGIYCFKILTTFEIGPGGRLGDLYYYDANDLALLIVGTLPLVVYFLRPNSKPTIRLLALAAAAMFVVSIVRTGSRGGFLGLLAVGIYLLLAFRAVPARIRFGAVAACAVLLFAVAGPRYWTMMGTMLNPTEDYNWSGNNEVGRMAIWTRGVGYMLDRPLFGVGANAFPVAEGTISEIAQRQQYGIGLKWSAAHNSFVQIGAELGFPGLVAFVLMIAIAMRVGWRIGKRRAGARGVHDRASLGQALVGTLIGYVVSGFFLSQGYAAFLYASLGLLVLLGSGVGDTPLAPRAAVAGRPLVRDVPRRRRMASPRPVARNSGRAI